MLRKVNSSAKLFHIWGCQCHCPSWSWFLIWKFQKACVTFRFLLALPTITDDSSWSSPRSLPPITEHTQGDRKKFEWQDKHEAAFKVMKTLLMTAPILYFLRTRSQTVGLTDGWNYALGCVLFQIIEQHLHPVTFHSRKCNLEELNFELQDKELLAIVTAFKEWRHYLEGSKFPTILYTAHKKH